MLHSIYLIAVCNLYLIPAVSARRYKKVHTYHKHQADLNGIGPRIKEHEDDIKVNQVEHVG